jgi:alpha-1,3-mannosyltransferase
MAINLIANPNPSEPSETFFTKLSKNRKIAFLALLAADALLVAAIITYIPYTKIDWDAYMAQVSGFLEGERDYANLQGDTGPLVYPAGFLYVYSAVQWITGGLVYPAQVLFGFLYVLNLGIVLFIYVKADVLPWWALSLLCISKRIHSIFVLRLFNDCFATTLLHASIVSVLYHRWNLGLIIFSAAVSIKMNVLLFAPPLLLLMLKAMGISSVILALAGAAFVQILLGLPFLLTYPISYITRAFNLGRVFIHHWSVNFKFVPEPIFLSKEFAISLLVSHLILLGVFAHYKWCKHEGGVFRFLNSKFIKMKLAIDKKSSSLKRKNDQNSSFKLLNNDHVLTTMFVGNFIGIVCARSLHYQFYSWYFYSLPYMLWKTPFPTYLRLILFCAVELGWNVFPSNVYASFMLFFAHLVILWGLWIAPSEYPYSKDNSSSNQNKRK